MLICGSKPFKKTELNADSYGPGSEVQNKETRTVQYQICHDFFIRILGQYCNSHIKRVWKKPSFSAEPPCKLQSRQYRKKRVVLCNFRFWASLIFVCQMGITNEPCTTGYAEANFRVSIFFLWFGRYIRYLQKR